MSSRMRVTRGHTGNRRSHHHIKEARLSTCGNCGALHIRHRMCGECGFYRGRMVIDILAKKQAKLKKMEERNALIQKTEEETQTEQKQEETKVEKEEK